MNLIFKIIKKVFTALFTLFAFNMMINPLNIVIPINIYTIFITVVFGLMALPFFSILIMFYL